MTTVPSGESIDVTWIVDVVYTLVALAPYVALWWWLS